MKNVRKGAPRLKNGNLLDSVNNTNDAEQFYARAIHLLLKSKIPFMIGGTYAFTVHTGIKRETKDLDIFCKAGDYPRFLKILADHGYKVEIWDARWLAKAKYKNYYIDIIFGSKTDQTPIDDTWFKHAPLVKLFSHQVRIIPAEELIWSKSYVQHREKYDGADVNHLILKKGKQLDWKRLLMRMEAHWEILFSHLINFRFVYPSERNLVPKWLMNELILRVKEQLNMPTPNDHISRGHLITDKHYEIDSKEWGFKSNKGI